MNTEYALVKLLLNDPTQISDLAAKGFNSKYFRNKNYGKVYDLIFDRYTRFNSVPTSDDLEKIDVEIGSEEVPHTVDHCVAVIYEEKVKELMQKAIVMSGEQLVTNGPNASIDFLRSAINAIPSLDNERRSAEVSETTDDFLERYHYRALNKGKILGVETGFPQIDKHVRGLGKQWLVVVQGRNGQFKSWVLSKMIAHQFVTKKNIAIFSCEMSREEFEERIYALVLSLIPRELTLGELNAGGYNALQEFLQEVKEEKYGKMHIDDSPQNLDVIKAKCQQIKSKHPLDIIYIDAAYGLSAAGKSDVERFGNIAKGCKMLAKEFDCPVVVSIQANRDFAKANPTAKKETVGSGMSAYGSDAWNQYADLMWIIHRTPDHAPFHFSDLIMDKFRQGEKMDSMLRINLKEPVIEETDRDKALARINGENPTAQKVSDNIFDEASQVFKMDDKQEYTLEFEDDPEETP